MRIFRTFAIALLIGPLVIGCQAGRRDVLFQTSTISALMEGAYDGELTCGRLKDRGDLGLGTFDALDGEMIVLDGRVYKVPADGKAYPASDAEKTPFAAVTFFEPDKTASPPGPLDYKQLAATIDAMLPTKNVPYAVRITGKFDYVKTRSIPRQSKPYPRLVDVAKKQPTFEFRSVRGTMVGFRLPKYVEGVNVPGYHLHFLTADRTAGGHVLKLTASTVKIEIDSCSAIHVSLPTTAGFGKADLSRRSNVGDLIKIEK